MTDRVRRDEKNCGGWEKKWQFASGRMSCADVCRVCFYDCRTVKVGGLGDVSDVLSSVWIEMIVVCCFLSVSVLLWWLK